MVQLDNEEKFISGVKKLKEEQKAAHQEKYCKKTSVEEMIKNQKKYSNLTTKVQQKKVLPGSSNGRKKRYS